MKPISKRKRAFIARNFESFEFGKRHLARMLAVSLSTVYRVFRDCQRTGNAVPKPGKCGRKRRVFTSEEIEA
ncbi:MAG: hypothetical protein AABW54_01140, partial [Candidatus Micrarchaeota archaeon]